MRNAHLPLLVLSAALCLPVSAAAAGPAKTPASIHAVSVPFGGSHAGLVAFGAGLRSLFDSPQGAALTGLDPFWKRLADSVIQGERGGWAGLAPVYESMSAAARAQVAALASQDSALPEKQAFAAVESLARVSDAALEYAQYAELEKRPRDDRDLEQWEEYAAALELLSPYGRGYASKHRRAARMVAELKRLKLERSIAGTAAALGTKLDAVDAIDPKSSAKDVVAAKLKKALIELEPGANHDVGAMHERGWLDVVAQDEVRAVRWYRRAVRRGSPEAEVQLARMFEEGRGTAKSSVRAYAHYLLAADAGEIRASEEAPRLRQLMTRAEIEDALSLYVALRQERAHPTPAPEKPASKVPALQALQAAVQFAKDMRHFAGFMFGFFSLWPPMALTAHLLGNPTSSEAYAVFFSFYGVMAVGFAWAIVATRRARRRVRDFLRGVMGQPVRRS